MSEAFLPGARGIGEKVRGLPMVRAVNLQKNFGKVKALRGVNLDVPTGEVMALMGPAGAGKTTLLRLIDHLDTVSAGELYVQGALLGYREEDGRLRQMKRSEIADQRRPIGMVFSRPNLFGHLSALDNVAEAPRRVTKLRKSAARDKAQSTLAKVGLADAAARYPAQLSAGALRRLEIARALAMDPTLLLVDDPTSGLDAGQGAEVLEVLSQLAREGLTMIVATREASFVRDVAHSVAVMDAGVVVESGMPQDVMLNPQNPRTQQIIDALR